MTAFFLLVISLNLFFLVRYLNFAPENGRSLLFKKIIKKIKEKRLLESLIIHFGRLFLFKFF